MNSLQPFYGNVMVSGKHIGFLARTVLVKNNDIDTAYRALDR